MKFTISYFLVFATPLKWKLPNAQSLDTFPAGTIVQANQTPGSGFTTMGTRNPVNGLTTLGIQGLALSPNLVEPQVSFDMATDVSIGNNVPIGVALGSYSVLPLPTILNSGILSSKSVPVGATTGDVPHWKDESTNRPLLRLQQDFPTPATYTNVTFSITQDSIIRDIASGADPALATGEFVIKSPDPALPNAQALSTIALDSAVLQTDALGNLTQAFKVYPTAAPAFQPDESPFYHSGEVAFANFPRVYAEFTYSFNLTAGALVSSGEFSVSDGVLTNTLYFSKDSLSGRDMTTLWTNFPIVKGYVSILGNGATGFVALIPDTPVSQPIPNVFSFDTSTFSSTSIPDQTIISFQLFIANGLVIDTTLNNIHSQPFGSPIAGTGNTVYRATVLTQPLVGDSNAIFGNGGGSITSASKCIAIGDATTLQNCVDSISNIAIGSGSLSAQAGYSCIAIGTDCADTSTGNTTSVFIGNGCNSTGSVDSSSCVVVGIEALFNSQNNVNTNSVIIGYQAGKDSGGNDSNVIIGTAAQAAGTCNKVSRCVIVGDGATTTVDGLSGCVLLGRQTQSGFDSAICIGQGCSASAANSLNLSQLTLAGTTPQSTNISLGKCEMMLPVTIDGVQYQLPLFLP